MSKIAVIDIGTNSIHMVLAEVLPDFSYKILDRFKDIARLGDGAFASQRLSEEAMARGLRSSTGSRRWQGTKATIGSSPWPPAPFAKRRTAATSSIS